MNYIDDFLAIEKELHLNDFQTDGFYFWNYFRTTLYKKMVDTLNANGEAFDQYNLTIKKMLSSAINCITKAEYKFPQKKHDILIMCHPRRVLRENAYESIYTDFITSHYDTLSVEIPYRGSHFVPPVSEGIFYLDYLYASRALEMKCKKVSTNPEIEKFVHEICNVFKERFDFEIDSNWLRSNILKLKARYKYTYNYFTKMVKTVDPKIIIEAVYYNFENMVMNEVAHNLGIKVIEFQHGVTGRDHCAYNFGSSTAVKQLPDEVLFFSDAWANSVRLPSYVERKSVGFHHFDEMREKYKIQEERNGIIFISSGTVGDSLSRFAVEAIKYIKENNLRYELIYKLHPGEYSSWREKYPWLEKSDINVVDNNEVHLYELFSRSIAQVGVYSTAIFEGIGYNLKTYILDNDNIDYVDILYDYSAAKLVSNVSEIFTSMQDSSSMCGALVFWKPNAKDNVFYEIDSNLEKYTKRQ